MQINKLFLAGIFTILCFGPAQGQIQDDPILKSIKSEIDRNKVGLHAGTLEAPFWISFRLLKKEQMSIAATQGDLLYKSVDSDNTGFSNILVGNYKLNNNNFQSTNPYNRAYVGKTNIESALKIAIWNQLDPAYKKAAESLERKKVQIVQQNIPDEDLKIDDWDQSEPVQYYQKREVQKSDIDFWSNYCRQASLALGQDSAILNSTFSMSLTQGDYYYYSTDGFMYKLPMCSIVLVGEVECRTKDGQKMTENYSYYFDDINDVIPISDLCKEFISYNKMLIEESNAPLISDSYSGPVLFEGSAVSNIVMDFFINKNNGLFAKRKPISQNNSNYYEYSDNYEYSEAPDKSENRMEQMINKKVADRRFDFISMTGTPRWKGQKLFGFTPIDAQGIKPDSSLVLIENGILKNLLSDRTPTKTNPKSNGHCLFKLNSPNGGLGVGVLRIKASKTIPGKELKDSLLSAAKDEGFDYSYIRRGFPHMSGGFLYKVYADGREEMVRNASINDLTQKQFKHVLHIGAEECIYNSTIDDCRSTLIVPCGIIFNELEIVRNNDQKLNKPFIAPRPQRKNKK